MNFHFKNSTQAKKLIENLVIGQIIKIKVIEKTDKNQYTIQFQDIILTAISEIDLRTHECYLKVNQLTPYPKLQLIIAENNKHTENLFKYTQENNLTIPQLTEQLQNILQNIQTEHTPKEIYDFIIWHSENAIWNYTAETFIALLNENTISINDILNFYSIYQVIINENENKTETQTKIITQENEKNIEHNIPEKIINKFHALPKTKNIKLAILYIDNDDTQIICPIQYTQNEQKKTIAGTLNTKNIGNITFKYYEKNSQNEITYKFQNSLFMNAALKEIQTNKKTYSGTTFKIENLQDAYRSVGTIIQKIIQKDIDIC